jgi:hypothetical protein
MLAFQTPIGTWNTPIFDIVLNWGLMLLLVTITALPGADCVTVVVTVVDNPVVLVTADIVDFGAVPLWPVTKLVVTVLTSVVTIVVAGCEPGFGDTPLAMLLCHTLVDRVRVLVLTTRFFSFGMICSSSLSGSLIKAVIRLWACLVASADPL